MIKYHLFFIDARQNTMEYELHDDTLSELIDAGRTVLLGRKDWVGFYICDNHRNIIVSEQRNTWGVPTIMPTYQVAWRRKLSTAPNDLGYTYKDLKLQTLIDSCVTLLLKDHVHSKYYSSFYILELDNMELGYKSHKVVYDSTQQATPGGFGLTDLVEYNTVQPVTPTPTVRNVCGIKVYEEHIEDEIPF